MAIAFIATFLIFGESCATIFKGSKSPVALNSSPAGSEVYINGYKMGVTPLNLKLESKGNYHIEFRKEGYATYTYMLTNHVGAGWVILDIVVGLLPVIVDAATGAWYELDQTSFNAVLEKEVY